MCACVAACFLGGVAVALEICLHVRIVTTMDIEGKGCVEPTANIESTWSFIFLYGWCSASPAHT